MKNMVVGSIGARTTAFKTVRIDELALQKNGITMETFDLSDIFSRMNSVGSASVEYKLKKAAFQEFSDFSKTPPAAFDNIVRLGVVIDKLMDECRLDAIAVRCWLEMQQVMGISPCVVLGELNSRKKIAACEVDVGNAIAMYALSKASGEPAACLDWNNNYGDDENKCILFHCGPVPSSMMAGRGVVEGHAILEGAVGEGRSFGCNVGRIKPSPFTYSSMLTDSGRLKFYLGQGEFTNDPIPENYFGCAGVAEIDKLQDVLLYVGRKGHRHHVSCTPGSVAQPAKEAMEYYLGFDVDTPQ